MDDGILRRAAADFKLPHVYEGIACHDAGEPYPLWCDLCLDEANRRDLAAMRLQPAEAVCYPAFDAFDDFEGEAWW